MCNNYERHVGRVEFGAALETAGLNLLSNEGETDMSAATDVRVGDTAPVLVTQGNGVTLAPMRWGFSPKRPGGAPVFNFRGDGRRFADSRRCIVPASAFFEFTGARSPKSRWRFTVAGEQVFGIAGLWHDEPDGVRFTMLTVAPGPDVCPFHDRQIAVLTPGEWGDWLYLSRPEADLIRPLRAGTFEVQLSRAGVEPPPADLTALTLHSDQKARGA